MAKKKAVRDIGNNQSMKLRRKINKAVRSGKLKRHQREELKQVKSAKAAKGQQRYQEFIDDYMFDRSVNSDDEADEIRQFKNTLRSDEEELLPIKLESGKVIKRVQKIETTSELEDEVEDPVESMDVKENDYSHLSASELLMKRKELYEEAREEIARICLSITSDPHFNISKCKKLLEMAIGSNVDYLIRDVVQKLATASLAKVFIDISPGYAIRALTEAEKSQTMKRETKAVVQFERFLLLYYLKYLKLLEKNAKPFLTNGKKVFDETTITHKLALISVRSMCQLLIRLTHFNYATNIVGCLTRMGTSSYQPVVIEACNALAELFKNDTIFRMSLHGVKSIATLVNQKKCYVTPELIATFLSLKIKEVDKNEKQKEQHRLKVRRSQLLKERKSKSAKKFAHQVQQLEYDLKKAEASESLSTRLKYATDTMKHVFATYFRVIKRMPSTKLLEPVLAGLSKFAHLINIEFFDDLINSLEDVVQMSHLRVVDSLHAVKTIFVILSGEGQALNIDPFKFYRVMYSMIPNIPFQKDDALREQEVRIMVDCIDLMLNRRKKQVSIARVVAFVKRLFAIVFLLSSKQCISVMACIRSVFLNHPRVATLIEDDSEAVANGIFRPDVSDPDTCNAMASSALPELTKLQMHPERIVGQFADNILHGLPSVGEKRIRPEWMTLCPSDWLTSDFVRNDHKSPYEKTIAKAANRQKQHGLNSKNVCSVVNTWLMQNNC